MSDPSVSDFLSQSLKEWAEGFKNSPPVKALEAAFGAFSFLSKVYEFWKELFFPARDSAALVLEYLQKLWDEMHDIHTDLATANAQGLIDYYRDYTTLRDPAHLDNLLQWSNDIRELLATLIDDWQARSAIRLAEIYNLIVPLDATIYLQAAAHAQAKVDAGSSPAVEAPVWEEVWQRIRSEFDEAIQVNQMLLGAYCFEELPNLPCYRLRHGKLFEAFKSGALDLERLTYLTQLVWQANERLREFTIDHYGDSDFWFALRGLRGCLQASSPAQFVQSAPLEEGAPGEQQWRVVYERFDAARIVHRTGGCLGIDHLERSDRNRRVVLLPRGGSGSEHNYELFVQEGGRIQHYWRTWQDGRWYRGESFGENVQSAPAAFQNQAPGAQYNYEVFVQEDGRVQHYWRKWGDGRWRKGERFGADVRSAPAAFQNRASVSLYNYEVFVREGSQVQHYWRSWRDGRWRQGERFGDNVRSAPAVFQNRPASPRLGDRERRKWNDYELFVRESDVVIHYWRSWREGRWHEGGGFGEKVRSAPAVFQNLAAGSLYNYEVLVREEDRLRHYWYDWSAEGWHRGEAFGDDVQSAPSAFQNRAYGAANNYEVFALEGGKIQHYWRSWQDGRWRKAQQVGSGVQSAPAAFQHRDLRDGQIWGIRSQDAYVVAKSKYNLLPPGEKDWYTYHKYLDLHDARHGPVDAHITSSPYVPGENSYLIISGAVARTLKTRRIALRSHGGQYVCAEGGGGDGVVANRPQLGPWETFVLVGLGEDRLALRAHNGQYLCAEGGGGGEMAANRDAAGPWETFVLVDLGEGKAALRTHGGQYVCAEGGGGRELVANRTAIGIWETFELVKVD